jgi:pyruvate/2-oxoglutarate dehydrogenase complex dihydrolipoamide acyltransferase (E2) component
MQAEIILPELGASPVVLSSWFAETGERVYQGDRLVELLTSGATFDVAAPATGWLVEKRALVNDRVKVGQVLGVVAIEQTDR